jgi:tetratricopeptide (TPR) repeat protein
MNRGVDPMLCLLTRCVLALSLLALPVIAHADWMEASSPHFVVYADESERDIRQFSEQLERYHAAMGIITGVANETPSPSNRVTVFVVSSQREVQRLLGAGSQNVGGFYLPRAGGPLAFVPKVRSGGKEIDQSMVVLLHEYAHHFMLSNSTFPSPRWLGEGAAEFFSSARFGADGGVTLGLPNTMRYVEIAYARDVSVEELLDPDLYEKKHGQAFDSFYGKSWALYHYLVFEPARRGQLHSYLQGLAAGKRSREAAVAAFGDLKTLDHELDSYLKRPKILSMMLAPAAVATTGKIDVRPLRPGEIAMMPIRMRSRRGVTPEQAKEVVADAREVAAKFKDDPAVLAALSEAEFDAGNDTEAIAAADAAIALDPRQVRAYVEKGYALFRQARDASDKEAAYKQAIAPFVALNKFENDNPLPLIFYYRSFAERGVKPPEQAALALRRAADLAPYDLDLRLELAEYEIDAGDYPAARSNLVPVAYNPHAGANSPMALAARELIERIDGGSPPNHAEAVKIVEAAFTQATAAASDKGDKGDKGA